MTNPQEADVSTGATARDTSEWSLADVATHATRHNIEASEVLALVRDGLDVVKEARLRSATPPVVQ